METIHRMIKIEDFLTKIIEMAKENPLSFSMNDYQGYTVERMANELRYSETNAKVIKIDNDYVEIANGVYAGNKATILGQKDGRLEVKIDGDRYMNRITIDINDLKYKNEEIKNVYILE